MLKDYNKLLFLCIQVVCGLHSGQIYLIISVYLHSFHELPRKFVPFMFMWQVLNYSSLQLPVYYDWHTLNYFEVVTN